MIWLLPPTVHWYNISENYIFNISDYVKIITSFKYFMKLRKQFWFLITARKSAMRCYEVFHQQAKKLSTTVTQVFLLVRPTFREIQLIVMIFPWLWCLFNLSHERKDNALRTNGKLVRELIKLLKSRKSLFCGVKKKLFSNKPNFDSKQIFT